MAQEKVRVYILARELNLESKDLLDLCRQHGIEVKNQLSSLEPEQRDQIEQLVKRGAATPAANKPAAPVVPSSQREMRRLDTPRKPSPLPPLQAPGTPTVGVPGVDTSAPAAPATLAPTTAAPTEIRPSTPVTPAAPAETTPRRPDVTPATPVPVLAPAARAPASPEAPSTTPPPQPAEKGSARHAAQVPASPPSAPATPPAKAPAAKTPSVVKESPPTTPVPPPPAAPPTPTKAPSLPAAASLPAGGVRNLGSGQRPGGDGGPRRSSGGGPRIISRQPTSTGATKPKPPAKEPKKPAADAGGMKKLASFTPEMLAKLRDRTGHVSVQEVLRPQAPVETTTAVEEEDEDKKGDKKKKPKDGVAGRESRQRERNERAKARKTRAAQVTIAGGVVDVITEDEEQIRRRRTSLDKVKAKARKGALIKPQGKIAIEVPITVRALSEALGVKSGELLFKLLGQGIAPAPTINTTIEAQAAELLALEYGRELDIKRALDSEEQALREQDKPDAPEALVPRAPIVTVMGHVDHGKTSLLDRIRKSNVVDTEAGGITQVIRAWRVEHGGKPITFLDTPGHEAFTKMRARGAHVTDIAVIVVAAEDGVMPQTEEAISHAKAAGVSLVVAINKVDLPNANINRTRQQLYGLNVLPDNMGGDTPFVETSAATGKGIDELLDQISLVAELKELKANPNRPAKGVCLETNLDPGEGVLATVLVQNGMLHRGDIVVCGVAFGRIRAMYNDLGQPILEAGPSIPVRITGLDEVPEADDPFMVVADLSVARTIGLKRKAKKVEAAQTARRAPLTLDQLTETKIAELKIILKADFRGSIEAIKKELEKLHHEEVRVRVLEAAIGAITENDVWLALTSPQDTLIIGFNAVPDDRARALAEERGIKILQYDIIYNLTKDIRAALEGKLKPREEVVHLGRAVVRETFKISRVGTIAGCYVTQGIIKRSGKIRLIREGVVIYPPADKVAGLESLKRFKEDVGEVREGFECGIKIAGYDDVKVGDVIEAFRVEEVKRTL